MSAPSVRERLIVSLDVPSVEDARGLIDRLGDTACHYKIGHALQFCGGLDLARDLVRDGNWVFLDVKLHDIPNTVENGVARIRDLGVGFVTVHAYPQTMAAAQRAAQGSSLQILGVTVLTSMADADLTDAGYAMSVADLVRQRARQAADIGVAGVVCAPPDIAIIREDVGDDLQLVTPGVRPAGSAAGDQKRVATPGDAIAAGADYLVVGRPIYAASDPAAAAQSVIDEIAQALGERNA